MIIGPRAPHLVPCVNDVGRRAPGRVVRVTIAKTMTALVVTLAVD
jgi:hypothetical protein